MKYTPLRRPELLIYDSISNMDRIYEVTSPLVRGENSLEKKKGVSVLILNLNKPHFINPLLDQLIQQQQIFNDNGLVLEIIVGDTGTTNKDVLNQYKKHGDQVKIVEDLKYHFSKCNNTLVFEHASCDHLLFLNNDIIFPSDSTSSILKNV